MISHGLYYRTAQHIVKLAVSTYKVCMDKLLAFYKRGGFNITKIKFDNEFCKVMDPFLEKQDLTIKMNYSAAQ